MAAEPVDPLTQRLDPRRSRTGGCWPDAQQQLLLRACLGPAGRAEEAYYLWRDQVDLDGLDLGSARMLPLLYRRLEGQVEDDDKLRRIRGVYRYHWARNQTLLKRAARVAARLRDQGIPVLALKGLALATLYYGDVGTRPMDDIDLAVPRARAQDALDLLLEDGWKPAQRQPADCLRFGHSCELTRPGEPTLDLHWRILVDHRPGDDSWFWESARPFKLLELPILRLAPEGETLLAVSHGVRWEAIPPIRWLADTEAILGSSTEDLSWDELQSKAREEGSVLPLKSTLAYLQTFLEVELPPGAQDLRSRLRAGPGERLRQGLKTRRPGPFSDLLLAAMRYLRSRRGTGLRKLARDWPAYLRFAWALNDGERAGALFLYRVWGSWRLLLPSFLRRAPERYVARAGSVEPGIPWSTVERIHREMEHRLLENQERLRYLESTRAVKDARNAGEIRTFAPTLHPRSSDHILIIDEPREWFGTGGCVVIIGWCLSRSQEPIEGIRAAVAGDQPVEANVGLPRSDVADAFPDHPWSEHSGFVLHASWKAGRGPLRLEICHQPGTWLHLCDLVCEYRPS